MSYAPKPARNGRAVFGFRRVSIGARPPCIGFDGGCLANRRGFGRFARRVRHALADEIGGDELIVLIDHPSREFVEIPDRCTVIPVEVRESPSQAASSTGRRRLGDLLAMGRAASRTGLDLMYFPATYSAFPVWNVGRVVVTMHDTLALAQPHLVFPNWKGRLAWAVKEHVAARRADLIVTVSQVARRDLMSWFHLPASRVAVVSEGPDPIFGPRLPGPESDAVLAARGIHPGGRYLLYVGGLSPHKNLPRLIEAFARSGLAGEGFQLVLVGDFADVFHTHVPAIRAAIERCRVDEQVVLTGFVPDSELVHLYNRTEALVQPSLMEGFGLPPVEAMACGKPVVCSSAGSLPEVVGDAGLFFDPTDVPAMADAMRLIIDDPGLRLTLASRARARAREFDWSRAARTLLERFDQLAGRPPQGPHWSRRRRAQTAGVRRPAE
ncbi:MAG: glycosyltransferase family 1 protein [Isosphaeraceae bacterium]